MPNTRTTVVLDDDLLKQTKHIAKVDSTTDALTFAMRELVRRNALRRLASLLGTDDSFEAAPRRRPVSE